ncbi:MAG: hypothetical protein JWM11_4279 [Planctomycetaceae bacterium]|nr:hypothetical protein [Planctomycetaceae bacterium]
MELISLSFILFTLLSFFAGLEPADTHVIAEASIESDGDSFTVTLDADGRSVEALFDFGCPCLVLDPRFVKCKSTGEPKLLTRGPNGEDFVIEKLFSPNRLQLGGALLDCEPVCQGMNVDYKNFRRGRQLRGVVGLNQFREYILEFDWDAKKLRLRNNVPEDLVEWVRFTRSANQPFPVIEGTITTPSDTKITQTSASSKLSPRERLKSEFESPDESIQVRFRLVATLRRSCDLFLTPEDRINLNRFGALQELDDPNAASPRADRLCKPYVLGNLTVANQRGEGLVATSNETESSSILYTAWMLRYHLAFDLQNRRLYLGARRQSPPPLRNPELSGLVVWREKGMIDDSEVKVLEVKPDSVAESAGIRVNDQIVCFNGRDFGEFRPYEVWLAQRIPETQHTLRIRRGEKEFDVAIRVPALLKVPANP